MATKSHPKRRGEPQLTDPDSQDPEARGKIREVLQEMGPFGELLLLQQELKEHGVHWTIGADEVFVEKGSAIPPHLVTRIGRLLEKAEAEEPGADSRPAEAETTLKITELEEGEAPPVRVALPPSFDEWTDPYAARPAEPERSAEESGSDDDE